MLTSMQLVFCFLNAELSIHDCIATLGRVFSLLYTDFVCEVAADLLMFSTVPVFACCFHDCQVLQRNIQTFGLAEDCQASFI